MARGSVLALGAFLGAAAPAGGGSASAAPTLTVLHSFKGSDGDSPEAGLLADSKGNLYGTTFLGARPGCPENGCGVVFKLAPGGKETVLYAFCSKPSCSDGFGPTAGLIADKEGNLYGTTQFGGRSGCVSPRPGCGLVFKLSPSGTEKVLHSFKGSDGANPFAGLIADSKGNLYGTTTSGGAPQQGVVFKLTPSETETVLYSFCSKPNCSDGNLPAGGLIADSSGNLYGTTQFGGASGNGVVFKLSPSGTEKVLHSFKGSDGAFPAGGLIADSSGNLHGMTGNGGASGKGCGGAGCGTVFKLSPSGTEKVLHSFCSKPNCSDGANPFASLIADKEGNLYGTTGSGGAKSPVCGGGCGTVFKLTPGGALTVLHSFTGGSDGAIPTAELLADSKGNLYGTARGGGASGKGVVFELTGTGFVPPNP
jgi:uncharacterized repeat protein (TIGR03803 family)